MAQQGAGRTVETEADMVYLVISVIDRDGTVTATIKLEPDTAATVLADLTNDPRAGPGVLLNKDDANIRESERKLQPEEGPYKYLLKLGRSAHEEPPGTDVSAFTKAVHDELDPIRKALERTSRSTVQASKISDDDLAALRDSVGAKVKYLSSDDDPEALTKLLIASPTNTDKVWGKEPEPDQRDMYHAVLRDNISASSRLFSWVDAKGLEVKLQVRGQYFKVVSKNDELLIVRNYGVEPPTGAVMGFEVKKALTKERLRQAEAEYYIFAHRSMFAYAQFYTDLTTGAVVFYSDKHADGQLTVNVHTLVGMSAVWDFAKAMLSAMPKDIGQACAHDDDFSPDELRSPKRIKLTGALFQPVSRIEAIRILCDIQSYDIACLEDLDDPNLYAQHNDLLQPFNS